MVNEIVVTAFISSALILIGSLLGFVLLKLQGE